MPNIGLDNERGVGEWKKSPEGSHFTDISNGWSETQLSWDSVNGWTETKFTSGFFYPWLMNTPCKISFPKSCKIIYPSCNKDYYFQAAKKFSHDWGNCTTLVDSKP